jgi:hypothetical protein
MQRFTFVPYAELGDRPHVVVDGAPTASTRLTLSHWPGSPTPVELLDDLSAQIAFHAIERPEVLGGLDVVSTNHFDQDGLASALALVDPAAAVARRAALIDLARAGDFATYAERDSIRLAFGLAALADPVRSTLDPGIFDGSYDERCGRLYLELLPRLAGFVDDPGRVRPLWEAEDAHLGESLRAIESGTITIHEDAALDLAIVRVPDDWSELATTRFAMHRDDAVHPAAVNQSTTCMRVAIVQGGTYRVELRYETWVMYRSRPLAPRPDLRVLAARLQELDPGAGWAATAPSTLTPSLHHAGESALGEVAFLAELRAFLAGAPAAWDPYHPER